MHCAPWRRAVSASCFRDGFARTAEPGDCACPTHPCRSAECDRARCTGAAALWWWRDARRACASRAPRRAHGGHASAAPAASGGHPRRVRASRGARVDAPAMAQARARGSAALSLALHAAAVVRRRASPRGGGGSESEVLQRGHAGRTCRCWPRAGRDPRSGCSRRRGRVVGGGRDAVGMVLPPRRSHDGIGSTVLPKWRAVSAHACARARRRPLRPLRDALLGGFAARRRVASRPPVLPRPVLTSRNQTAREHT